MSALTSSYMPGTLMLEPWVAAAQLYGVQELGPTPGLHVNLAPCELFCRKGNTCTSFSLDVRCFLLPSLGILRVSIEDYCTKCITGKCAESRELLSGLVDMAAVDHLVAVTLLHAHVWGFWRMVHIARVNKQIWWHVCEE